MEKYKLKPFNYFKDAEGGASPGMVVMLVIFTLMGIISGIVFYKKRQSNDIESTPLTNSH
jgi:hypothetical protein